MFIKGRVINGVVSRCARWLFIVEGVSGHVASGWNETFVLQVVESEILMSNLVADTASP